MDEIFTAKSESPIEYRKKNTHIISTLRSETDDDYQEKPEKQDKQKKPEKLKQTQKYVQPNNKNNIQDDIVNIAETIHNLANMMNEQMEKITFLEKEISNLKKTDKIENKIIENNKSCESESELEFEPVPILKKEQHVTKNRRNFAPSVKKNTNFDTCTSDTCNDYMITKNVEHKLQSVANGFNGELLEMKKQQAIILSSFLSKKNKKNICRKK